jgi:radical SAM superfamily enzyme YgiQ (UPF0313 family)
METSRGCPYRCAYCYNSVGRGNNWRGASAPWVAERLLELKAGRPQAGRVDFVDDNFFVSRERALAISGAIASKVGLRFTCNGGCVRDLLRFSDAELSEMAACGLDRIDIGVETGSTAIMDLIDKHETPDQVRQVCRMLTRAGIAAWINLMVGFPGETKADLKSTVRLADDLLRSFRPLFISPIYSYAPYPGTRLWEGLKEKGCALATGFDPARSTWSRPQTPWLSTRERKRLGRLYFYSFFIDRKILIYRDSWWLRMALAVVRPVARFRVRRLFFGLPLLKWAYDLVRGRDY